jgi:hypothetical protein
MERFNRSLLFWVLLVVTVALPVSAQVKFKKQVYATNIFDTSHRGIGVAQFSICVATGGGACPNNIGGFNYIARTYGFPGVTKATLDGDATIPWPGEIVLCDNNDASQAPCEYDASGNLDIEGAIVAAMFPAPGFGGTFFNTVTQEHLMIHLYSGADRVATGGPFDRIF